jgi:hypothetical protein
MWSKKKKSGMLPCTKCLERNWRGVARNAEGVHTMNELSRRDYFAAAALTGLLVNRRIGTPIAVTVSDAYLYADAMIEAGQLEVEVVLAATKDVR